MDLMFGTDNKDTDDFAAREFRLKELLRAQKLSAGPNFVVSFFSILGKNLYSYVILMCHYGIHGFTKDSDLSFGVPNMCRNSLSLEIRNMTT